MVPTAVVPSWESEHNQDDNFTLLFVPFLNAHPFFTQINLQRVRLLDYFFCVEQINAPHGKNLFGNAEINRRFRFSLKYYIV